MDTVLAAEIFAQAQEPVGIWNWWFVPAILTFLMGVLTWWANKQSKEREHKQREIETALNQEKADMDKVKIVLDAYEEQMSALTESNKDLSSKLIATQTSVLDCKTRTGILEVKIERLTSEREMLVAERDSLKGRLADALG